MNDGKGRLESKIALVTGAASGLGAAAARRLAAEGARVILTDVAADPGKRVAAEIQGAGGLATFCHHDVTQPDDWEGVVSAVLKRFGGLNVLVNNAGVGGAPEQLMTYAYEAWRHTLSVNLDGVFLGLRYAGPAIAASGGGSVINVSSIMGKVAIPGAAAYCASKGGVALLTKAAALEWAPLGIRVNSVHPGFVDTPMVADGLRQAGNANELRDLIISRHPLGRLGAPREIADAVVFLASDESSFMTGAELVVDGGYTAQ